MLQCSSLGGANSACPVSAITPSNSFPEPASIAALGSRSALPAGRDRIMCTFAQPWQWLAVTVTGLLMAIAASAIWRAEERRASLRIALTAMGLVIAAGTALVWARSEMVGADPLDYPCVERFDAEVLDREEQTSKERVRLILAMRNSETGSAQKIRMNLRIKNDLENIREGATIRLRARLMPPAPPMLPGGYSHRRALFAAQLPPEMAQG